MSAAILLEPILLGRLSGERRAWLERALITRDPLSFALASRKVGTEALVLTADEREKLEGLGWLCAKTSVDEIARVLLIVTSAPADLGEWYRQGDNAEKRAVLRALSLVPEPSTQTEVGAIACRSSVQSVFEAICCENPFPAAHFSELAFNQMVLKALFTEVALDRIHRLDDRKNAELARMAAGYASERTAAGRTVPADIGRVTGD